MAQEQNDGMRGDAPAERLEEELWATTQTLIQSRQNISPKNLTAPGPSAAQLEQLFEAAAAAPDHGMLHPWRFVIIPREQRGQLAEMFAQALIGRDPQATPEQVERAREKAHRAPLLILVVARLGPAEPDIPALERMVSLGCAIQNMLLSAHAMSFGTGLTGGQAMDSAPMRALFALGQGEQAVCFINIGTVTRRKPPCIRPRPSEFVSTL